MIQPRLSIVIACYNVEKYVDRCLKSVLSQTCNDYEIILVNDGSTDATVQIINENIAGHSNCKLFHKTNEGLYSARNMGLKEAQGQYVYFMDGDDWLEKNLVDENLKLCEGTDIVFFGFYRDHLNSRFQTSTKMSYKRTPEINVRGKEFFKFLGAGLGTTVWQMFIRRKLILDNNVSFPKLKRGADMYFLFRLYAVENLKSRVNSSCYYHYLLFRSSKKVDHKILNNHIHIYSQANYFFSVADNSLEKKEYRAKLFCLWFMHSVPNGIVGNPDNSFFRKMKILKELLENQSIACWYKEINDDRPFKNKIVNILLQLYSLNSVTAVYLVTWIRRQVFKMNIVDLKKLLNN